MLDDDKGHAAGWRDVGKKLFQRFKPTRRGADANNRKGARAAVAGDLTSAAWVVLVGFFGLGMADYFLFIIFW